MAFRITERHFTDFHTYGFTVFRRALPASLVRDLRRVSDKGRTIARQVRGPDAQRLQPVGSYDLDPRPFRDYAELPELVDAVQRLLTPRHRYGNPQRLGIFYEPAERPWCTEWHRDWRDHMPVEVFEDEFRADWIRHMYDLEHMNQINCALYDDACTWYVPGSHFRVEATAGEMAAREADDKALLRGTAGNLTNEERERLCLQHCERMPGAVRLFLDPGDFAIYRPNGWHLGCYAPYRIRATLHDTPMTPEVERYLAERGPRKEKAMERYNAKRNAEALAK
ncbi:MAG: phytanoyl-CoA dioxygenase family protein [Planctomycetes bacterium]|nr:phytanoyl-CoA dioxygenase family protein [Planctomycetota bacterium]